MYIIYKIFTFNKISQKFLFIINIISHHTYIYSIFNLSHIKYFQIKKPVISQYT